jgi:hypothetical protein
MLVGMAIRETEIPPLASDPQYAAAARIERALRDKLRETERAIDRVELERELSRIGALSRPVASPRVQMMQAQLKKLRAEQKSVEAPPPPGDVPEVVRRALLLLQGQAVEPTPDRAEQLKRLRADAEILEAGIRAQAVLVEEIRAERSRVVAERLRGRHQTILRSLFDAAMALSAAVEAERALYASVLSAGYEGRPDILVRPGLDGASRLGTPREWDSQISHFRRRLEAQGVL